MCGVDIVKGCGTADGTRGRAALPCTEIGAVAIVVLASFRLHLHVVNASIEGRSSLCVGIV